MYSFKVAISVGQRRELLNSFTNTSKSQIMLVMGMFNAVFSSAYVDGLIDRDVTLLYKVGVDPVIAMKTAGRTDYKTTTNIYTHVRDEMLKKATVNMGEVFGSREKG